MRGQNRRSMPVLPERTDELRRRRDGAQHLLQNSSGMIRRTLENLTCFLAIELIYYNFLIAVTGSPYSLWLKLSGAGAVASLVLIAWLGGGSLENRNDYADPENQ
jgi:hypothetical protein